MTVFLRDPAAIYRASRQTIEAETDLSGLPDALVPCVLRMVHACGMPDIVADLAWSTGFAEHTGRALADGARIFVDSRMAAAGIQQDRLPGGNPVFCLLDHPEVAMLAARERTTKSAAAVMLWRAELADAVVAIGAAPTALVELLTAIDRGAPRPAAILGFPVGFVGAAESKRMLADNSRGVPFLTLHGRRGGSAVSAAAINGLALGADW